MRMKKLVHFLAAAASAGLLLLAGGTSPSYASEVRQVKFEPCSWYMPASIVKWVKTGFTKPGPVCIADTDGFSFSFSQPEAEAPPSPKTAAAQEAPQPIVMQAMKFWPVMNSNPQEMKAVHWPSFAAQIEFSESVTAASHKACEWFVRTEVDKDGQSISRTTVCLTADIFEFFESNFGVRRPDSIG